jgi:hypothetical protein
MRVRTYGEFTFSRLSAESDYLVLDTNVKPDKPELSLVEVNGKPKLRGSWYLEDDKRPLPVAVYIEMRWTTSTGTITLDQTISEEFLGTEEAFKNS